MYGYDTLMAPARLRRGDPKPLPAALPALLMPVRIEARFSGDPRRPELWLRIFPDQVAVDAHDPRVTDAEVEAARRYWETIWRAGTSDTAAAKAAWASLAQRVGPTRAAYLIHSPLLTPANIAARPVATTPEGTPLAPAPDFPAIAAADKRPAAWSAAPRARALPERWTVTLQRDGTVVHRATSAPIPADLAVGPDPGLARAPAADGLAIDDGMRWMVDFDEAVAVGMGLRIPIDAVDARRGFDRVLVHGLASSAPGAGPAILQAIVEAHRFTDGFAFVPQGSATNNTTDAAAGYSRSDPGFEQSYALEAGPVIAADDGKVFADFLGLPGEAIERAAHADGKDQANARWMTLALWPATLGYFLEQIMSEVIGPRTREQIRSYVLDEVRGRGMLPAFRVGETPYGVLPTTSLLRYAPRHQRSVLPAIADGLRRLWPVWQTSARLAPHIERGGDHDAQLVGILGMDASARAYRVRYALGEEFIRHAVTWLNVGADREYDFITDPAKAELARLGYDFDARLTHLALTKVDHRVPFAIVDDKPVSETEGLPAVPLPDGTAGNYISWLRHAPISSLQDDERSFPGGKAPTALLYKVLRQAVLTEYSQFTLSILIGTGAEATVARERELVGFTRDHEHERPTVWEALRRPFPEAASFQQTISSHIADQVRRRMPDYSRLWELYDALDALAPLPTAELERLFTETVDTYSHRIDPWVTSLALELDKERLGAGSRSFHIGAFGWLEDLRPSVAPAPVEGLLAERVAELDAVRRERSPHAPPPRPAGMPREDNAGFIHAPSLVQAEAGAVLRNGYLTHRDSSNGQLLAIDLSSDRVRVALDFLEGIRQGQPLTALLGYRFERALVAAGMQVLVQPFRDNFPLVANRLTTPAGPVEAVAAANVVNGIALHEAWKNGKLWPGPFGASSSQRATIDGFLGDLDDVLDTLGDLSIAESVYQIMRGNPVKAGGLIDAISRGERPPDPELVRTPRGGIDLTHRLALLFTPGPARKAGWPGAAHPRAQAEPRLDAWASHLLPAPAHVRCLVRYKRPATPAGELTVTLADLDLGPLDALAVAAATGDEQATELEQRVLHHARSTAPADATDFEFVFEPQASWAARDRSFPQLLVAGQALYRLLAESRPLAPQDLFVPERRALDHGAALDNTELNARVTAALNQIAADAAALDAATTAPALCDALTAGSLYGVVGSVPVSAVGADPATVTALSKQAAAVGAELHERHDSAQAIDGAFDRTKASAEQLRDHLIRLLQAILGAGFAVCPQFTPPNAAELGAAFASSASMLAGDVDAPERWFAQLTPVRPGADRFDMARNAGQLVAGRYPPPFVIAQLPRTTPDRWLALRLAPGAPQPASGRVSIVAEIHPAHHPAQPHSGLLLDEWPERIPASEQSTGLTFHFDQPSARAPQTLLMAISPTDGGDWNDELVEAILGETLDLAKARAVDLESLASLGQLLPTLLFPFNADGETVSLGFEDIRCWRRSRSGAGSSRGRASSAWSAPFRHRSETRSGCSHASGRSASFSATTQARRSPRRSGRSRFG